MKNKILIFVLIGAIVIPQVASAAWWNPFSWNIFKRVSAPQSQEIQTSISTENTATTTNTAEMSEVEKLRAEVEELKKLKTTSPTTQSTSKQNVTTSSVAPQITQPTTLSRDALYADVVQKYTNFKNTITNEKGGLKKNSSLSMERTYFAYLDELLNKINSDLGYLENIKGWSSRPAVEETYLAKFNKLKGDYDIQSRSYNADIQAEQRQNYHTDALIRLNSIISQGESFKEWLSDTNDQLRTTVMLIANKPYAMGSLVNDCRAASIDLANAEIQVISSLSSSVQEDITNWKMLRDHLNSNSSEFVSKNDLDLIPTLDFMKNDYSTVRNKINDTLNSVTDGMKC